MPKAENSETEFEVSAVARSGRGCKIPGDGGTVQSEH